jgi:hypothetical protein
MNVGSKRGRRLRRRKSTRSLKVAASPRPLRGHSFFEMADSGSGYADTSNSGPTRAVEFPRRFAVELPPSAAA